jgi:hypothetical protein
MKTKLKPGDRVAVYGIQTEDCWSERVVGTVTIIQRDPPRIFFTPDERLSHGREEMAIPQQCRRLKPKRKAREFWIAMMGEDVISIGGRSVFRQNPGRPNDGERTYVFVREVLK